jgi:hypothetical protein
MNSLSCTVRPALQAFFQSYNSDHHRILCLRRSPQLVQLQQASSTSNVVEHDDELSGNAVTNLYNIRSFLDSIVKIAS